MNNMKDEWIFGRDRSKLWVVCGENVAADLTSLNANKVMSKLPDVTSLACIILNRHRNEIESHKLSTVWASVGVRGIKGAFTVFYKCKMFRMMPNDC